MFELPAILKLLSAIGPVTARLPEFKGLFDQIVTTFKGKQDQKTLQQAYQDLMDENTGGHARLQEKLRIASKDAGVTLQNPARGPGPTDANAVDLGGKPSPAVKGK